MRDEDFQVFIDEFGEATSRVNVPQESIEKWRGKLPEQLLTYWQQEGWCSYAGGLFWTVDPTDYEDIVDEWLEDTPFEQLDSFHVIARSAFGKLYLIGESIGCSTKISCVISSIYALPKELKRKNERDLTLNVQSFFCFRGKADCDIKDEAGKPLFERALKKLGPLAIDEMYGFEPAIVLGGKMLLDNLVKVKIDQHLTILRQLAAPTLPFSHLDIDKLLK